MNTEIQKFEITDEVLTKFLDVFGASKLSPAEKTQFIQISKAFGLNPFKREIHMIKYGQEFSIVVGYEVYLKRAEASGLLQGWKCWTEGDLNPVKKKITKKGVNGNYEKEITVYEGNFKACIEIIRKDWTNPFYHEVYLSEYAKENEFWGKPITMLKKVVMGQGFRLCFTEFCGGLPYTEEEAQSFVQADVITDIPITALQMSALELVKTAIFSDPKSYTKTENEIRKDSDPEKVQKIIDYLKTKQPETKIQKEIPIEEAHEIKEIEELSEKEKEIMDKIDSGQDISESQGKEPAQMTIFEQNELLKEKSNDKI